jgi:hypothetical protein
MIKALLETGRSSSSKHGRGTGSDIIHEIAEIDRWSRIPRLIVNYMGI